MMRGLLPQVEEKRRMTEGDRETHVRDGERKRKEGTRKNIYWSSQDDDQER